MGPFSKGFALGVSICIFFIGITLGIILGPLMLVFGRVLRRIAKEA
jgi:hypothetical protein